MPNNGEDALNGIKEYINGEHTFTVDDQTSVIATGMLIMIFAAGEVQACWHGKTTGATGQPVSRGYRVRVYNADVEFR